MGHDGIKAAHRYHGAAVAAVVHLGVELDVVQIGGQAHRSIEDFYLVGCGAVKEAVSIQHLGIEIQEDNIDEFLKPTVLLGVGHRIDDE